jgi:DNA-binding transcriptional regulator YdaS (Cro superfamily)
MNIESVQKRLRAIISLHAIKGQAAISLGVSHAYLSQVITGKRPIGPKLLKGMGIEAVTTYRYIKTEAGK